MHEPDPAQSWYPVYMMCLGKTGQAVGHAPPVCDSCMLATSGGDTKERAKCDLLEEP